MEDYYPYPEFPKAYSRLEQTPRSSVINSNAIDAHVCLVFLNPQEYLGKYTMWGKMVLSRLSKQLLDSITNNVFILLQIFYFFIFY